MATEKRLIDANAFIRDTRFILGGVATDTYWQGYGDALDRIEELAQQYPTVDAVEVPCKIGDKVWAIRNYNGIKHPQKGFVSDMLFTRDMRLQIVVKHIARGEWGKAVFATYEEAAEAIGERKSYG